MYKVTDYIRNGVLLIRNTVFPGNKKLAQLMIYATNRCQSRCRHCSIWQKPHDTLSKDEIVSIMSSSCISRHTTVGLEGGEFVLHPQVAEILEWFQANHPNYTLLSNCLLPQKVIDLTRCYLPSIFTSRLTGTATHIKICEGWTATTR